MRYQTVGAGETWSVVGRFPTGRTVSCALYNAETGAAIGLDSTTTAEIGTTGLFHFDSDQVTTDPTSLTTIVWQMTDATSGATDEGVIVIGGYVDNIDDSIADLAADVAVVDGNVDAILVDTGTTIPAQITALNDPTAAAIADAVWDEALSGHTTAGTAGEGAIVAAYGNAIYIDTTFGTAGTALFRGTRGDPVDNLTDALAIGASIGINRYVFLDSVTINPTAGNLTSMYGGTFVATVPSTFENTTTVAGLLFFEVFEGPWILTFTDLQVQACQFRDMIGARFVNAGSEYVTSSVFFNCGLSGTLEKGVGGGGNNYFGACFSEKSTTSPGAPTFTGNTNSTDWIVNFEGDITFAGVTVSGGNLEYDITGLSANVTIASSVSQAGEIEVGGLATVVDNSTGGTFIDKRIPSPSAGENADAVWDEVRSGHSTVGTFGEFTGAEAMRGTDGANTVVPLAAATDQAEHDATQAALAVVDANVDAILVDTGTTIPGLISALNDPTVAAIATEVWQTVLSTASAGSGDAAETLRTLEKIFTNDATVVDIGGGINQVTIFDDDGTTVLRRMNVTSDGLTRTVIVGG